MPWNKGWFGRGSIWMIFLFAFCLTACGKKESTRELGINGYVFQSVQVPVAEGCYIENIKAREDSLCFITNGGIYSIPVEENMDFGKRQLLAADSGMTDYTFGPDGVLYYVTADYRMGKGYEFVPAGCTLVKMAEDGRQEWRKPFPDIPISLDGKCLAADGKGQLFLMAGDVLYQINEAGEIESTISLEKNGFSDGVRQLMAGAEGHVYYCTSRYGTSDETWEIYEITEAAEVPLKALPGRAGIPYSSAFGLLCDSEDGIVYQYKGDPAVWEPVFRWGDSCLNSARTNSNELVQTDEEHFSALLMDVTSDDFHTDLYQLTRTAVAELPEKEILVLAAAGYTSDDLKQWVSHFNRENERYHVIIEQYGMDEIDTKLNSRLLSSEPPDLVDVTELDVVAYGEKQTFADLTPFLEASDILAREMFFDRLLDAYSIGGRLVCIPRSFYIKAVFGRTSEVGIEAGWTAEEAMKLAEQYQDRRLLAVGDQFLVSQLFGTWLCEQYIDWESGECAFDSEEFGGFLEWLKTYQDRNRGEFAYEYLSENCVLYLEYMRGLHDRARHEWNLGEEITFIGQPTSDGRPCIPVKVQDALCITSRSGNREGAWEFLEYFLAGEAVSAYSFSSRRDLFQRALEAEMTPEYFYTEDGEIEMMDGWVDREGNVLSGPNMKAKRWVGDMGNTEVLYYYMSAEEADAVMKIFEEIDFTPGGGLKGKVLEIFEEEIPGYLEGGRPAEEVAEIIQNRVKNLVQENLQ